MFPSWKVCLDIKLNIDKKLTITKQKYNVNMTLIAYRIMSRKLASKTSFFFSKKKKRVPQEKY